MFLTAQAAGVANKVCVLIGTDFAPEVHIGRALVAGKEDNSVVAQAERVDLGEQLTDEFIEEIDVGQVFRHTGIDTLITEMRGLDRIEKGLYLAAFKVCTVDFQI